MGSKVANGFEVIDFLTFVVVKNKQKKYLGL